MLSVEDTVVDTESNLWYVVLQKNLYKLGLPENMFIAYRLNSANLRICHCEPVGRGNLLVKCYDNRRSTRRFPRRYAPRNDRLGALLNKTDKHNMFYGYQRDIDALVNRRNSIAHGNSRSGVSESEYTNWERKIGLIFSEITRQLYSYVNQQRYLK